MNTETTTNTKEPGSPPALRSSSAWLTPTGLGVAATLVTVFLSFVGYGYALAVESMFGVPESLFADSPLDYLRLSSHVVGQWLSVVARLGDGDFYVWLFNRIWPSCAVLSVLWLAFVYARTSNRAHAKGRTVQANATHSTWWQKIRGVGDRCEAEIKWTALVLVGLWTLIPAAFVLVIFVFLAIALMLAFVPLLGLKTGEYHLHKWVIEPTACLPTRSQASRVEAQNAKDNSSSNINVPEKEIRGVACVKVQDGDKKNGDAVHQGRVVVTTAKWIVLFDPISGAVWRLPVSGSQVTVVDDLPSTKAVTASPSSDGRSP